MFFREKKLEKILAIILAFLLAFNPVVVPLVWASEEEQTEEPVVQVEVSGESVGEGDSTIVTGDAESQAEVETTANTHEDTIPGEITTPPGDCTPPEGETDCPNDITISNDNLADVADTATSSATTGNNKIEGTGGNASITTGEATASGSINNEVNTNTIILEPTPTVEPTPTPTPSPTPMPLFISEYVEGLSNNKAIEIYNPTGSSVDLVAGGYKLEFYFNGSVSPGTTINLSGLVNPADVFVVAHNDAVQAIKDVADQISAASFYNGNDAVVLKSSSEILDVIGQIGADPGTEWGSGDTSTADNTLVRKCAITQGDTNGSDAFDPSIEWDGYPNETFNYLGSHSLCPPSPTPTPSPTPEEEKTLTIENKNEGNLENEADVLADTGENLANENGGNATIDTGDALAYANLLNLLNTNIVGSDFRILLLNQLQGQQGDIDLNQLWKEIQAGQAEGLEISGSQPTAFLIENNNLAALVNELDVMAVSGGNQANDNGGEVIIKTGDATALANVVNLVNTNLVGAKFFLGVINIFGSFVGNLILPGPEEFGGGGVVIEGLEGTGASLPSFVFENQNQAEVEGQLEARAETGGNEEINNLGNDFIETGEAEAQAHSFSLVNLNIWRNDWFFLIINHLGKRTGQILGWSTPSAQEEPDGENEVYQLGLDKPTQEIEEALVWDLPLFNFQNQNQARVKNDIYVSASTGQNQANENQGDTQITTGKARSLANLLNFINLNILGGRWFMGVVNILGDWEGDTVYAHADVAVTLSNGTGQVTPGETTAYTLSFKNQGHNEADEVVVSFELPKGVSFLSDSSGLTPEISGQTYSWFLGRLETGEGGGFNIQVQINQDFPFEDKESPAFLSKIWSRIIPQAHAQENEKESEVIATALIGTSDSESDLSNNTASAKTLVYLPLSSQPESQEEASQGQPMLEISAWNNVGEFVYAGDTVTFEIIISNKGDAASHDTYLVQELFNGIPTEGFGTAEFEIGTLEPGKSARLSFGLALKDNGLLPAGPYHTVAQAFGLGPDDEEVVSNKARTNFELRLREVASVFEARAAGKEEEVLGALQNKCQEPRLEEDILPYVLLLFLSALWLVERSKRKFKIGPEA